MSANARRPPPFEGWETDLVKELNHTVDLRALSRDMPRLKVSSPARFSVRHEAWKLNKDQLEEKKQHSSSSKNDEDDQKPISDGEQQLHAQLEEKADRMCAALLHLEDLINVAQQKAVASHEPDAAEETAKETAENPMSPLRKNSLEMYPKFYRDADLSQAFTTLLRNTGWLPTEEKEAETSESTGLRKGNIPCEELPPQVRILGTMAQTVIFAPSQRMTHLLWHPVFARNLMDVDWEVFLMDKPWPESGMKKISKNNNSNTASPKKNNKKQKSEKELTEKSPLLGPSNNLNDEEDDDNNTPSPTQKIEVQGVASAHADENPTTSSNNIIDPDQGEMIYVCHRIIAKNVVSPEDVNRLPRFQVHWVLEIHCGKRTGVIKRCRIAGVRVRITDDEAAVDAASSCCCGGAGEWRDFREELAQKVAEGFGIELEKIEDGNPF